MGGDRKDWPFTWNLPRGPRAGEKPGVGTPPREGNGTHSFIHGAHSPSPEAHSRASFHRQPQFPQIKASFKEEFPGPICLRAPAHSGAGQQKGCPRARRPLYPPPHPGALAANLALPASQILQENWKSRTCTVPQA